MRNLSNLLGLVLNTCPVLNFNPLLVFRWVWCWKSVVDKQNGCLYWHPFCLFYCARSFSWSYCALLPRIWVNLSSDIQTGDHTGWTRGGAHHCNPQIELGGVKSFPNRVQIYSNLTKNHRFHINCSKFTVSNFLSLRYYILNI